jgi:hypothetical protein
MMTAATATVAVFVAFLIIKFMPGSKWGFKFALLALMLGAVNFSDGWIGRTLGRVSDAVSSSVGSVTNAATGTATPMLAGIGAAFVVGWALWPKHSVTRSSGKGLQSGTAALAAAALLPLLATSISGPVGQFVRCGVSEANQATGGIVGAGFDTGGVSPNGGHCLDVASTGSTNAEERGR